MDALTVPRGASDRPKTVVRCRGRALRHCQDRRQSGATSLLMRGAAGFARRLTNRLWLRYDSFQQLSLGDAETSENVEAPK